MEQIIQQRRIKVLYDKKWRCLTKRVWPFRFIPFVDFAFAAGSMATGNVKESSDFDVIIGVKKGRIFTARFFSVLVFGFLGWRRKKLSHKESAKDKICLNHFVTKDSYKLSPPYNEYWITLYKNLVPIFGNQDYIREFWLANKNWLGEVNFNDDLRYKYKSHSFIKKFLNKILSGTLGNFLEQILKNIQVKKIESSLSNDLPGFKPRIKYSDAELEFHPDTKRIEDFLKSL